MNIHQPKSVRVPFFTHGTLVLLGLIAVGYSFGLTRLISGLGTVTNLDNHNPWGIWIAFDVACGVALAAGGFTTAALVEIFGGKKYKSLLRPAILTALIGYIWVAIALMFDLGRYWNIWRPLFNWQGNSVLFEVAMCVMFYLFVLSIEMSPSILEGLRERIGGNQLGAIFLRKIERPLLVVYTWVKTILPIFIVAGVVLSCMHQSSLGTLMLIAPTKVNALWLSPMLPLLFLLSAIMVGFPMVIMESIIAGVSFKRNPEMEILGPLARKIPWFIAVYSIVKIADLIIRRDQINLLSHPDNFIALTIEIIFGLVAPFILLNIKAVRKSAGWLFFSAMLIIFGVVMNRINVFLVGYNPPYLQKGYFPSIGEISLTIAIICSVMFVYRFFVIFFPILPGSKHEGSSREEQRDFEREVPVKPLLTWVFRGTAGAMLLTIVVVYALVHQKAIASSQMAMQKVQNLMREKSEPSSLESFPHAGRPIGYKNMYVLQSAALNKKTDFFEPVRFSHRTHDVNTGSECSICHHRQSAGGDDRVGEDLKAMHASIDVRIGGPCASCHEDMTQKPQQRCSECHGFPNQADDRSRTGLKGAYHQQCIGCHEKQPPSANAPIDCASCHHPLTPDHALLVKVSDNPQPEEVTAACLKCHDKVGRDILDTAHWNWKGVSPEISGFEHSTSVGLFNTIDNYTISSIPTLINTTAYHIGYGIKGNAFDFTNASKIDCLICHDTTRSYRKDALRNGLPAADIDLKAVYRSVGRPSRFNCGSCHFNAIGGTNVKQGDLEPALLDCSPDLDVHMGMVDMRCQDCHTTKSHKIYGLSFNAPVTEGRVSCEQCHGAKPHGLTGSLSRHLDKHVITVACETCHIPSFARESPTLVDSDFSSAGRQRKPELDEYGKPAYDPRLGMLTWKKNAMPVYRWFDGTRGSYILGDKIDPTGTVSLNPPLGQRFDPAAKIHPFKIHTAKQPYDAKKDILVPVKFEDGYWNDYNWDKAIAAGMTTAGMTYSGRYGFVRTEMYTPIRHEVVPAKKALGCADCHRVEAISCSRCHQNALDLNQPVHTRMVYPEMKNRLDFKALGYSDDPAQKGGRFYIYLGKGKPPK